MSSEGRLPRCVQGNRSISLGSNITRAVADVEVDAAKVIALAAIVSPAYVCGKGEQRGKAPNPIPQ